jgi:hypothetical protein
LAEAGFGTTVFGASNVFTLLTLDAVSISPAADLAFTPARLIQFPQADLDQRW